MLAGQWIFWFRQMVESSRLAEDVLDFFVKKIEEVDVRRASALEARVLDQVVLEERLQTVFLAHNHQLQAIKRSQN